MKNIQFLLLCLLGGLLGACQKEQPLNAPLSHQEVTQPTSTILVDGSGAVLKSGNPDDIILGNDKPNLYAHDNVLAAWNTVYPTTNRPTCPLRTTPTTLILWRKLFGVWERPTTLLTGK
jgi:hypothetical protein